MTLVLGNNISKTMKMEKELVFQKDMTSKKNGFSIYSNGIIELKGRILKNSIINIPKEITQWFEIGNRSNILQIQIKSVSAGTHYLNILIKITKIKNGIYIHLSNSSDFQHREIIICQINMINNSYFIPTKKYQKALTLLNSVQLPNVCLLTPIINGGKGNRKFTIYRDKGLLFIKAIGTLTDGGSISLSYQLNHYIKDWFKKSELVIASKDGEETMIIETRIIRQHTGRKPEKCLYFPYCGKRKSITVLFSSPDFELTEIAEKDLQLMSLLECRGLSLKTLKSYSSALGDHCDFSYELLVRNIIKQFATTRDLILLPEVLLNFNNSDENINGNRKIVDVIAVNKRLQFLLLCEIKTSDKTLSSELEYAIADLLHTTRKINKFVYVFPFLFINQDILRLHTHFQITKQYGLSCGVLLIGLSATMNIRDSLDLIIDTMLEY